MPEHVPRTILVTGGLGFIGTNLIRHLLASDPTLRIVDLDALTYAGNPANLADLSPAQAARHQHVHGSICDQPLVAGLFADQRPDTVIHLAAESHVDRSIDNPLAFVHTNVVGTATLLQVARNAWRDREDVRFHHVSTDEVYGALGAEGSFHEDTAYDPSSPYSASKAASDHLVRAWQRTFGLPVTLSNCSNNYGPYQFPEKLIPLTIANALAGRPLPVYGRGLNIRDWLHVDDHARAIDAIVRHGTPGRTWNVGGNAEMRNIDVVHLLCDLLDELRPSGRPSGYRAQISFVTDRPGHDQRYAIDASRITGELGWRPQLTFASGLRATVQWYLDHAGWIEAVRNGSYRGERLGLGVPSASR